MLTFNIVVLFLDGLGEMCTNTMKDCNNSFFDLPGNCTQGYRGVELFGKIPASGVEFPFFHCTKDFMNVFDSDIVHGNVLGIQVLDYLS